MPGVEPPGTESGWMEPAFDGWAVHDEYGMVISEGRQELGLPERKRLSTEDEWRLFEASYRMVVSPAPSIHPEIEKALSDGDPEAELDVLLAVRSSRPLQALPRYYEGSDRLSAENAPVRAERERLRGEDAALRAQERLSLLDHARELGAKVLAEFTTGNSVALRIRAGGLLRLISDHPEIAAVSPDRNPAGPAGFATILTGRTRAQTDYLVSAGYNGAYRYIGLLDTGTMQTHRTLAEPDKILFWRDCANTIMPNCTATPLLPYNPSDAYAPGTGHGTAMANIILGSSAIGDAYRGVAPGAYLDSANVYSGTNHDTVSSSAVVRAINWLDYYDDVLVVNVAADEQPDGPISLAADDLYSLGVIVVAPVGNCAVCSTSAPANAHKVLGVSGYFADTGLEDEAHAIGLNNIFDRIKPDLSAPTQVWAAATYHIGGVAEFGGTCTAAAYAGGAAAILRHYYDYRGWSPDPGAIYAAMINFGDEDNLGDGDGAGNLTIGPLSNTVWMSGVRYLSPTQSATVSFTIPSGACNLRAAIWWAESNQTIHDAISLDLYEGTNLLKYTFEVNSIFQKVVWPYPLNPGSWSIKLFSPMGNHQDNLKVHYAIHYKTNC